MWSTIFVIFIETVYKIVATIMTSRKGIYGKLFTASRENDTTEIKMYVGNRFHWDENTIEPNLNNLSTTPYNNNKF